MRIKTIASRWLHELWYQSSGQSLVRWTKPLLLPASRVYLKLLLQHQHWQSSHAQRLSAYVISIGNLVVGGTGKTPLTIWIADFLSAKGWRVAVLSRGYASKQGGVSRVPSTYRESRQIAEKYGDEPVLIARRNRNVSVWVARNRAAAGKMALSLESPQVLILDDGFQHLLLKRDLDLVLINSEYPFGNGHLLPLGPLREPTNHLHRAHALILTGGTVDHNSESLENRLRHKFPGKMIFRCVPVIRSFRVAMREIQIPLQFAEGKPVLAFTGIAHPRSFFAMLQNAGLDVRARLSFPDHHLYQTRDLDLILTLARRCSARLLVTTEKDMVRLPGWFQQMVLATQLELSFPSDGARFGNYLQAKIIAKR